MIFQCLELSLRPSPRPLRLTQIQYETGFEFTEALKASHVEEGKHEQRMAWRVLGEEQYTMHKHFSMKEVQNDLVKPSVSSKLSTDHLRVCMQKLSVRIRSRVRSSVMVIHGLGLGLGTKALEYRR